MGTRQVALLVASAIVLSGLAAYGVRRMSQPRPCRPAPPTFRIRPAGPEVMDNPPEEWDIIDEQSDASFPASDPPGNY
jgi:hypothetical protein